MTDSLATHTKNMMLAVQSVLTSHPDLTNVTGDINVKGDQSIQADVAAETTVISYIRQNLPSANIFSEESGASIQQSSAPYLIAFDPLDGSTNYALGKGLLPFGFLMCIFGGNSPLIGDVVAAGAIELTTGLGWIYDGHHTITLDDRQVVISDDWVANRSTPFYFDLYYREAYEAYAALPEEVFIRNTGSSIGNLTLVLAGAAAGLGSVRMRPEEIGAIYALIQGAGGVVVDHDGTDLGLRPFSSNSTYPILAGSKLVIEFVAGKIRNGDNSSNALKS
jgi:fructose-1,6-bisphosphatase/inositol monophosphatase family enzyme